MDVETQMKKFYPVGARITAQQKRGPVFTGEVVDSTLTATGGVRYTLYLSPDEQKDIMSYTSQDGVIIYVYGDEIIPNAVDLDELRASACNA